MKWDGEKVNNVDGSGIKEPNERRMLEKIEVLAAWLIKDERWINTKSSTDDGRVYGEDTRVEKKEIRSVWKKVDERLSIVVKVAVRKQHISDDKMPQVGKMGNFHAKRIMK